MKIIGKILGILLIIAGILLTVISGSVFFGDGENQKLQEASEPIMIGSIIGFIVGIIILVISTHKKDDKK
jgi:uncharacterized membrane protein YdcZ (DUF606 family)